MRILVSLGVLSLCVYGVLSMSAARAQGTPDPSRRADLATALEAALPSLTACDRLLTPAERSASPRLVIAFVIDATGGVREARVLERGRGAGVSTLASPGVRSCVLENVALWVFPRARIAKNRPALVNVEFPVRFPVGAAKPGARTLD